MSENTEDHPDRVRFVIGGREHMVPIMSLRTTRLSMRILPKVYLSKDVDQLLGAFLVIFEDTVRDTDQPMTIEQIESTMRGSEMEAFLLSMHELFQKSGLESKGELDPMAAGLRALMTQTEPSTGSSSPSEERASREEAGS